VLRQNLGTESNNGAPHRMRLESQLETTESCAPISKTAQTMAGEHS
jgi:hypothetical protein